MAVRFQGGKAVSVGGANKSKMSGAITKLEQAIEQARQVASEMMANDGPGSTYNTFHIKDIQKELRDMYSSLSMMRSSLNGIK